MKYVRLQSRERDTNNKLPGYSNQVRNPGCSTTAQHKPYADATEIIYHTTNEVKRELTLARHIDQHIHVDIHGSGGVSVDAELVVWPSPDVLAKIVEHQKESHEGDEDGQKAS